MRTSSVQICQGLIVGAQLESATGRALVSSVPAEPARSPLGMARARRSRAASVRREVSSECKRIGQDFVKMGRSGLSNRQRLVQRHLGSGFAGRASESGRRLSANYRHSQTRKTVVRPLFHALKRIVGRRLPASSTPTRLEIKFIQKLEIVYAANLKITTDIWHTTICSHSARL